MDFITKWLQENREKTIAAAAYIFDHPEIALEESLSSAYMAEYMQEQGFTVAYGDGGMKTAFTASWGSGKPVLGFLAEFDALPELGQKPVSHYCKVDGPGHGCGHNLLGMGAAAAACGLKAHMEQSGITGTVRLYGCPAEEIMYGKIKMAEDGAFDDLDVAITWHPFDYNRVGYDIWQAMDVKKYRFYGKTAHAAGSPHLGRSALDAAELMNVGVNYLREHVTDDVRMHYTYLNGGDKPNIVPDFAETYYYIRGANREHVDDASFRVDEIARGAAIMTGTKWECELISGCREMKVNRKLSEVFYQAMEETSLPEYTEEELQFARQIQKEAGFAETEELFGGLLPLNEKPEYMPVATDVSDVSHIIPTIMLNAAAGCKGTPLHHWSMTAQAGSSIGYKGMLYVAEAMARGGKELVENKELLTQVWGEFRQN